MVKKFTIVAILIFVTDCQENMVTKKFFFVKCFVEDVQNQTTLPTKEQFYNQMKQKHISQSMIGVQFRIHSTCTTLGKYADIYPKPAV